MIINIVGIAVGLIIASKLESKWAFIAYVIKAFCSCFPVYDTVKWHKVRVVVPGKLFARHTHIIVKVSSYKLMSPEIVIWPMGLNAFATHQHKAYSKA